MRVITFTCLMLLLAGSLAAAAGAEINGKWTADTLLSPAGAETPVPTTFTFKVDGDKLTGAVDSPRGKFDILEGKIDGDSIAFHALVPVNDNRVKLLYDGRITAEGIDFISKFVGGDRSDHFLAKRASP